MSPSGPGAGPADPAVGTGVRAEATGRSGDCVAVRVGRIGRAHGIRGDVTVRVLTDEPERRFADGVRLRVLPPREPTAAFPTSLTVASTRWHSGTLLVRFAEAADRNAAEALRGGLLEADVPADERPDDPEEFYDRDLIGLVAVDTGGTRLGSVREVIHRPEQDLLEVVFDEGRTQLVPFVTAWVPDVDLAAGQVTIADADALTAED